MNKMRNLTKKWKSIFKNPENSRAEGYNDAKERIN